MIYFTAALIGVFIIAAYRQGLNDGKRIEGVGKLREINLSPIYEKSKGFINDLKNSKSRTEAEDIEIKRQAALKRQNAAVDDFCNKGGIV